MTHRIAIPAAIAIMLAAAPVTAAAWADGHHRSTEARIEADFRQLSRQFDRAARAGAIDRRQARHIGQQLARIDQLGSRYARDGRFNRGERQRLERLIGEARFDLRQSARAPRRQQWHRQDARWQRDW